jgi:hypothetical protein
MQSSQLIAAIDEEIDRLHQVRTLLIGDGTSPAIRRRKATQPATAFPFGAKSAKPARKRRRLSAEGRARIAAAQKARWARIKKAKAPTK